MTDSETKKPKLESSRVIEASALREHATSYRQLGAALLAAELAANWKAVAEVRSSLAQIALGLDALAEEREV